SSDWRERMLRSRGEPLVASPKLRVVTNERQGCLVGGQAQIAAPAMTDGRLPLKRPRGILCGLRSRQPDQATAPIVPLDGADQSQEGAGHGSAEARDGVQEGMGATSAIETRKMAFHLADLLGEQRIASHRPADADTGGPGAGSQSPTALGRLI